jgi:hypothetical protein
MASVYVINSFCMSSLPVVKDNKPRALLYTRVCIVNIIHKKVSD